MLLTSPAFVIGLALQVPFALAAWALARWLLGLVGEAILRTPVCPHWAFVRAAVDPVGARHPIDVRIPPGEGPPLLLRQRLIAMPPGEAARPTEEDS